MAFRKFKGDEKGESTGFENGEPKESERPSERPPENDQQERLADYGDEYFISNRIILFASSHSISIETFGEFASRIFYLSYVNPKAPIHIILNNYGGCIYSTLAIYDLLKECPCPIIIKAYGAVMSGASIILQAGDVRIMSKNCTMMIHGAFRSIEGPVDALRNWSKDDMRIKRTMINIYTKRMKQKNKRQIIEDQLKTDTILTSKEALKLGLIDAVQ